MRHLIVLVFLLVPLAGCFGDEAAEGPTRVEVRLEDNRFVPENGTVNGTIPVRWTNEGAANHTVTIDDPDDPGVRLLDVEDPGLQPGNHMEFTFPAPGNYTVYCRYHVDAGMQMTVLVTP